MATLSIRLLGGLVLTCDSDDRAAHFSGRQRSLLAYFLLHAGSPQSRQTLAFMFWPDSAEKQARTNLRKLLLLLRAALGPYEKHLEITDRTVTWRMDAGCWFDVASFTHALSATANARPDERARLLCEAVELYRGDLLPDCYDEWLLAAREALRDQYIHALEQLCAGYEADGRYAEGVKVARRLLQHDPIYEQGHLQLIRLQALMNDRAGALQSYHRCAALLRRELGVDPSAAMEALYLQLLDHEMPAPVRVGGALAVTAQSSSIPLVGRAAAWQHLLNRWQMAQQGQSHFTLISGEAGIGKSRLAEELMIWVDRQGNVAAHTRAYGSDNRTLTYAPIVRLLRVPAIHSNMMRLPPYWLTEIARLLPELVLERDDISPPLPMQDDWQRHHLFAALTQALLPKRRGHLVVIDDLHWSDSETVAWLPHLLEQAKDEKLLIVGTVRSEEFDDHPGLKSLCETLQRRGQFSEINLTPLAARETVELARLAGGGTLAAAQTRWLTDATEGNPLFVIETARWLCDEGAAIQPGHAQDHSTNGGTNGHAHATVQQSTGQQSTELPNSGLPQSVLTVIEARLSRLSKSARTLAEAAATIGRSFTLPVLAAAAALGENELVDALDELWRRRIIRERETDGYDFSHDRIRDGAYRGISALRRRILHKRVAAAILATQRDALEDGTGEIGGGEISGQLGYHFEVANERTSAIEHYMLAARSAEGQFAHAEALRYLDRVLALALPNEAALRFDALLLRDTALEISAPLAVWQENLEGLRQLATASNLASWRATVAHRASRIDRRAHRHADAIRHAKIAVDEAQQTDDVNLQALCHYALSQSLWFVADFEACIPHVEQAISLARQVGNAELLARALEQRAQTHMFDGGTAAAIQELLDEAILNYDKAGSLVGRCNMLNKLAYLQFAQGWGVYEGARDLLLETVRLAKQIGSVIAEAMAQRNLAIVYTCMGNYAAALPHLQRTQEIYRQNVPDADDPTLLNYWGFYLFSQGRLEDALAMQLAALAGLTSHSVRQWRVKALTALGWIHLRLGKHDEAVRYAEESMAQSGAINEQRQLAYALIVRGILHTNRGELVAARARFADACAILHAYEMENRAQEAEVGLAYVDFLEGENACALERTHAILAHLEAHPIDFTEDSCQLLYTCLCILRVLDGAALPRLCKLIQLHLSTRTATLDAETTRLFWQHPIHQELRELIVCAG